MSRSWNALRYLAGIFAVLWLGGCAAGTTEEHTEKEIRELAIAEEDIAFDYTAEEEIVFSENSGEILIGESGSYMLFGECSDGRLTVDAKNAEVRLVLNGLSLTSEDGPALLIKNAKKVMLTLKKDTENSITDAENYLADDIPENADAVIFSKADLVINGEGSLFIKGNYKHGIVSKDEFVITGGTTEIEAAGAGIQGKDALIIGGGKLSVKAAADGIKTTNTEEKGEIYICGGEIGIECGGDAISAENSILIENGMIGICTNTIENEESTSKKGIKAENSIVIIDGKITAETEDDAVHSDGNAEIKGGEFLIKSGDDGIHAEEELLISGGNIVIEESYEGLEAANISVSGGKILITAKDDGMNASAGAETTDSMDVFDRNNPFMADGSKTEISGGYIMINAGGDGIDSNGEFIISGGELYVAGSENGGNGGIDSANTPVISGGKVIVTQAVGMEQSFSMDSEQVSFYHKLAESTNGEICIKDENDNEIIRFAPGKSWQSVIVSDPSLEIGKKYGIYVDDLLVEEITIESTSHGYVEGMGGRPGGQRPEGMQEGDFRGGDFRENPMPLPSDGNLPSGMPGRGERPDGMKPPEVSMDTNGSD
ncbi:MAG: carbohydrate-binding domain-containing protein [Christensenellaceae bacterium]|nr:carbohydrate-binding domain-containing protein [Christensenellaceae bacterium]